MSPSQGNGLVVDRVWGVGGGYGSVGGGHATDGLGTLDG